MTMTDDRRILAALQAERLKRAAEHSLCAFVDQAWTILEPTTLFLPSWHIDVICEYLEAVTAGEILRLVINLPPRYMKSLLVTVLWPLWEWLHDPGSRWLFLSYSDSLAMQHSLDRRQVLLSEWYQGPWGDRVQLTSDQNEKTQYRNTRRGLMTATSLSGTVTGKGGNRIVVDDPHNPLQAESDTQRQRAIDLFLGTVTTRLDDKQHGAIVVVQQRVHTADLSATCLDLGYTHLCLPAVAETRTTIVGPRSKKVILREEGDLLWPAREGPAEIAQRKIELGAYGFASQYQQSPSPRGGGIFKRAWWAYYDEPPDDVEEVAQSWDLAVKGGTGHDFVVGLVAARRGADIYLIDRVKAQLSFNEQLEAIRRMCAAYPAARTILVEAAANGIPVVETLKHTIPGIIAVTPKGGKVERAAACAPRVEAGNVYLPRPTGPDGRRIPGRDWVDDFIQQLAVFPKGAHDDDVDAFTQLLLRWQRRGIPSGTIIRRLRERGQGGDPAPEAILTGPTECLAPQERDRDDGPGPSFGPSPTDTPTVHACDLDCRRRP